MTRHWLLMLCAVPAIACSSAGDPTSEQQPSPDETGAADPSVHDQTEVGGEDAVATPKFTVTVEPGHTVSWFELAPGRVVALESSKFEQELRLSDSPDVLEQYHSVQAEGAPPTQLVDLAERVELFKDMTPEELVAVASDYGFPNLRLPPAEFEEEPLVEGQPDNFLGDVGQGPGLGTLSVGAPDNGDDSAFPRQFFIDVTNCNNTGLEIRRLRRTGNDDARLDDITRGEGSAAAYRGSFTFSVKARIWWDWSTLFDDKIMSGNGQRVRWNSGSLDGDIKTAIRHAESNGWHMCLQVPPLPGED